MPKLKQYDRSKLENALRDIQNGTESYRTAKKKYGIPKSTLEFKLKHPGHKETLGPSPVLTLEEEALLKMSKRSGQKTLDFFVSKKSRTSDPEPTLASTSVDQDHNAPGSDLSAESCNVNQDYQEEKQNVAGAWTDDRAAQYSGEIDIGKYVKIVKEGANKMSDLEKSNILKNSFLPDEHFSFPYSVHRKNDKDIKCYLSIKHFNLFNWLTYSKSLNGLFCKFCVLFAKSGGLHKASSLNKLVVSPLQKYSKLLGKEGDLSVHGSSNYHKESVLFAQNFLKAYENPEREISNILDSNRLEQVHDNRKKILSIINTITFLGKQNIALRGHREDSNITEPSTEVNRGNLLEFIHHRIETCGEDLILKNHFESATSRKKYISPSIQNEIIKCCGDEIINTIVQKVTASKYYSIVFDETTDRSKISQMSIVIRYLDENCNIREDFLSFLDCHQETYDDYTQEPILTGKKLGQTVVNFILNP
nr:unnamed protein product [Callosobruchus chinensis]